ncbi:MAG: 50S ribosomal protein L11 [Candidatus Woykebacteria bacterium RBG_13_40_7b]|uniref:Large ribosomal subunit protein uL11 n=1 Tax=Candidatus Woykebacteria bacterium RBG_13_40_7b TaxID=1802594 RepID=A0A1G1WB25_9BACT|nr:MAG: 50S ribosomal protein L11 [Candidatus Woykebacteria bacterium RBG_13_40_7b]
MKKKIKQIVKIYASAGEATAAPPIGPALGTAGINIGEFIRSFNEKTANQKGSLLPVEITVYEDRTFTFVTKTPPASYLIKKALNLEKGSGVPQRDKVGKLTQDQLTQIAQTKLPDLNTKDLEKAKNIIEGTARNMGVEIQE